MVSNTSGLPTAHAATYSDYSGNTRTVTLPGGAPVPARGSAKLYAALQAASRSAGVARATAMGRLGELELARSLAGALTQRKAAEATLKADLATYGWNPRAKPRPVVSASAATAGAAPTGNAPPTVGALPPGTIAGLGALMGASGVDQAVNEMVLKVQRAVQSNRMTTARAAYLRIQQQAQTAATASGRLAAQRALAVLDSINIPAQIAVAGGGGSANPAAAAAAAAASAQTNSHGNGQQGNGLDPAQGLIPQPPPVVTEQPGSPAAQTQAPAPAPASAPAAAPAAAETETPAAETETPTAPAAPAATAEVDDEEDAVDEEEDSWASSFNAIFGEDHRDPNSTSYQMLEAFVGQVQVLPEEIRDVIDFNVPSARLQSAVDGALATLDPSKHPTADSLLDFQLFANMANLSGDPRRQWLGQRAELILDALRISAGRSTATEEELVTVFGATVGGGPNPMNPGTAPAANAGQLNAIVPAPGLSVGAQSQLPAAAGAPAVAVTAAATPGNGGIVSGSAAAAAASGAVVPVAPPQLGLLAQAAQVASWTASALGFTAPTTPATPGSVGFATPGTAPRPPTGAAAEEQTEAEAMAILSNPSPARSVAMNSVGVRAQRARLARLAGEAATGASAEDMQARRAEMFNAFSQLLTLHGDPTISQVRAANIPTLAASAATHLYSNSRELREKVTTLAFGAASSIPADQRNNAAAGILNQAKAALEELFPRQMAGIDTSTARGAMMKNILTGKTPAEVGAVKAARAILANLEALFLAQQGPLANFTTPRKPGRT